jgi:hypothetical protein
MTAAESKGRFASRALPYVSLLMTGSDRSADGPWRGSDRAPPQPVRGAVSRTRYRPPHFKQRIQDRLKKGAAQAPSSERRHHQISRSWVDSTIITPAFRFFGTHG